MSPRFLRLPATFLPRLFALTLLLAQAHAATVTAAYHSANDVPVTSNGYTAAGNTVNVTLNFKPAAGAELMVVKNTGLGFISGTFANLAQGQVVSLPFNGTSYPFVANYYGGTGNDLVLVWAKNRAFAWGFSSALGGSGARDIPVAVSTWGVLEGKTILAVASGFGHSLALCSDGTLAAWGRNSEGQLGDNSTSFRFSPVLVHTGGALAGKTVIAISAGVFHSLALCSDGTIAAWGKNEDGQLGDNTNTSRLSPVAVYRGNGSALAGKTAIAIRAGAHHSLALCSDGTVAAWGLNANAQLGDNTTISRKSPMEVSRASGSALASRTVIAIAAGNYHSMALCSDGAIAAWGNNNDGQLGQLNPVTKTVEDIEVVVELFKGSTYTIFGQTLGAGTKVPGQLTTYTEIAERRVPGLVRTSGDVSALHNKGVIAIHAGLTHSLALCSDGTIAAWGDNTSGKLGDGTTAKRPVPVAVVRNGTALAGKTPIALGGGRHFSTALLSDGTVTAWGENEYGQMGDDSNATRHKAVAVNTESLAPGERYIRISGGSETFHTVAIVGVPILPEMNVSGNGVLIASGALKTDAADHTDFGISALGASVVRTFTIRNDGPAALNLAGATKVTLTGADSAGFSVTQQPELAQIASGGSTTFAITYAPTLVGQRSTATVSIASDDTLRNPYTFTVQGAGPVPDIAVIGNTVAIAAGSTVASAADFTEFPTAAVGAGVARTFTVKNGGLGPLSFTGASPITINGANAADFAVTQQPVGPVASNGGTTTFQITYTPSAVGKRSVATVSIASNDVSKNPFTFAIAGTGPLPEMIVSGNGVSITHGNTVTSTGDFTYFGTAALGVPVTRTFTITNSGLGALSLVGAKVTIGGANAADFAVTQQPASSVASGGGTTTFQISYTPAVIAKLSTATVSVASDDPKNNPYTFTVQGIGPVPEIGVAGNSLAIVSGKTAVSPADHTDFGTAPLGTPVVRTFTIKNTGPSALNLTGASKVTVSGANAADFAVTQQPAAQVAADGGSTTFQVSYTPTVPGKISTATLTIASDDPKKAAFTFTVRGTGPVPEMVVRGNNVVIANGNAVASSADHTDFGTSAIGAPVVRTFTIVNTGLSTLSLSGTPKVNVTGAIADFTVTQQAGASVAPSGTTTFQVTFNPVANGVRTANIEIASDDLKSTPYTFVVRGSGPTPTIVSGTPLGWGGNFYGQLGDGGASTSANTAVKVDMTGVLAGKTVSSIALGAQHALAIASDGRAYAWGNNANGRLGNNSLVTSKVPVAVDTSGVLKNKTIVAVAAGAIHSAALTSDGKVFGWGYNLYGQLGANGSYNFDNPVPLAADMSFLPNGQTVTAIAAGDYDTYVLTSAGKVYSAGVNTSGQLGFETDGRSAGKFTAVNTSGVLAGKTITQIAPGVGHVVVLASDGTLYAWGDNGAGQLGNGTKTSSSLPVAVDMTGALAGKKVKFVVSGNNHSLALTTDGKIYAWGGNFAGHLGDGTKVGSAVPVAVDMTGALAGKTIVTLGAGQSSSFALTSDGKAYAWGGQSSSGTNSMINLLVAPTPVDTCGALDGATIASLFASGNSQGAAVIATFAPPEPPVAIGDSYAATEDKQLVVPAAAGVLANDVIRCGTTVTLVSTTTNGTLNLNADGSFTYTPSANFNGSDVFTYTATNTSGTSNVASVRIATSAVNDGPTVALASSAITVMQNSGAYAAGSDFAVFSPGPENESAQVIAGYTVTNTNNALFSVQPAISTTGTLTFTAAAGISGNTTVTVVGQDNGGTANNGADSQTRTFTITVTPANTAPAVTFAANKITVPQNSGAYGSGAGFATFSSGETSQSLLGYVVTNDNTALFSVQPALSNNGVLTFTPAAGKNGAATVTVIARDNGGIAGGGVDTVTRTFTIVVTAINAAPSVAFASSSVSVVQNSGAYTAGAGFATFSPGPASEAAQTLLGYTVSNSNAALFQTPPALSQAGALTFALAANARGNATVTVVAQDSGGTANGGVDTTTATFSIVVSPINSAPAVAFATETVTARKNAGPQTVGAFATFSPGPLADASQTLLGYTVSNDNNALFSAQPAINHVGVLTFTPATDATGRATVTVIVRDNGGTAGGGIDSSTRTFTIEVKDIDALYVVTTTADSGPGSLREAILNANAAGGPVTILINNGLGALNPTPPLPTITGAVTIDGGSGNTIGAPILIGSGGTMRLGGTTLSGSVTVQSGGTFAGDGEVEDELIVEAGGILSPGSSPGIIKTGKATWNGGGVYEWEITDADGDAGIASDLLTVKKTLTLNVTADNQFTLKLKTLSSANTAGPMANFDATRSYFWTIARCLDLDPAEPSTSAPRIVGFDGNGFVIDKTGFANATAGGRFALLVSGNALILAFTPDNPPVASDDNYVMDQGDTLVVVEAQGVLANDIDADFSPTTAVLLTNPANGGAVTLNANGSFTFAPSSASFHGIDTFSYRANDGTLDSAFAGTVTVTVYARPANTVPAAQFTLRNTALRFSATTLPASNAIRVSDADSTALTVDLAVAHGSLSVTATNGLTLAKGATGASISLAGATADVNAALETLVYTPAADYSGEDTLTIESIDEGGRANRGNATVAITIAPPPSITSAATTSATYRADFTFGVTATGHGVTFGASGLPAGLTLDSATGAITGAPTVSGSFPVALTATDAGGNTDTRTLTLDVARINLTVAGIKAVTRIYDATTTAALDLAGASLVGIAAADDVKLVTTAATGTFVSKAIGTGKTVAVAGLALDGAHIAHYTLTQPTTTADITPASLTVAGVSAADKVYDGTATATLNLAAAALVGVVPGDAVTLVTSGASGAFANASVGLAKPVAIAGLAREGADAGNYTLTQPSTHATITPASVMISFGNLNHVYDGTAKQVSVTASPTVPIAVSYSVPTMVNAGSYNITASVTDSNYKGSSSATLTIAKATQTITLGAPATAALGSSIAIGATASSGLPVTLAVSGPASLSGSQLTFNAPGTATLTATQPGDANHAAATATATITVEGKLAQTIALGAPADRLSNSGSFTLSATATSGLPVTFAIVSGPAMLSGQTVTLTGAAGQVIIRASQAGNAVYEPAPDVTATFTVTAATLNVFFGTVANSGDGGAKAGDIAATLPPNSNQGSLLVVAPGVGINTVLDFTLNADGTFTQTVIVDAPAAGPSASDTPVRAAAPMTLTVTGTLINGQLRGIIEPLGLAFSAHVLPVTGPSANAAGFYKSSTLANTTGATYSVVGTHNEVLVLAQTPEVTTGGMTTLGADGTFGIQTATALGTATIRGTVDEPTTTVAGTISLPGKPDTSFAGLVVTTTRTDRLVNLSSRVRIGAGDRVLITGFVIGGEEPKQVLIRGIGPALSSFGVQGALSNPRIQIYRGSEIVAENDDWYVTANAGALGSVFARLGAFTLGNGSTDAALVATLPPGAYTAQVLGGGDTGVALAEIYDASTNPNSEYQRLVNISTRGEAGTGENVLIGGFVVTGNAPKKLLVRGIGPGLTAFGVGGALVDPRLRIYRGTEVLAENDNWSAGSVAATATLVEAARDTGAFALAGGSRDAALILTLAPGSYTAQVGGADNTSTGIALVEVYEIPE